MSVLLGLVLIVSGFVGGTADVDDDGFDGDDGGGCRSVSDIPDGWYITG